MPKFKLPRYVNAWVDKRTGQVQCRFRRFRTGPSIPLPGTIGSNEFWAAYQAALKAVQSPTTLGSERTKPGTFNALIVAYYETAKWKHEYSDATRSTRRPYIERFRAEHGNSRVSHLTVEYARLMLGAIAKPNTKRHFRKAILPLMDFAVSVGMTPANPFAAIKLDKIKKSSGYHTWDDDEIAQYRSFWALGTQQRLAMELALETGSRRSDVTKIGPQHIRQGVLHIQQQKTGAIVDIEVTPELRAAIDTIPIGQRALTFLTTHRGAPRSPKALSGDFRKWCDAAGLPKRCSIHGLRKALLRQVADGEASPHEIMALSGHKSLSEAQKYTEEFNRKKLARSGMAKRRKNQEHE
jgi:integrase